MISDEVWDQVREAWFATIPEQYRHTGKEHNNSNHAIGAIILSPPKPLLDRWFADIRQHLTKEQLRAKAAREACGRNGMREPVLDVTEPRRRKRSRARAQPSLPEVQALPSSLP